MNDPVRIRGGNGFGSDVASVTQDRYRVAKAEDLFERNLPDAQLALGIHFAGAARVEDLAGEAPDQLGVAAPDPSHPDDAERCTAQVPAQVGARVKAAPAPAAQVGLRLGDVARGGQRQRQRQLGGRVGEHVRGVGDRDAASPAGVEIDVVVADREVGDHLELRAGRLQQRPVHGHRGVGDDRVHAVCQLEQLLPGDIEAAIPDHTCPSEPLHARTEQLARHQDGGGRARIDRGGRVSHRARRSAKSAPPARSALDRRRAPCRLAPHPGALES